MVGGGDEEGDVGTLVAILSEDEVVDGAAGGGAVVADLGAEVLAREVGRVDLVVAEKVEPWIFFLPNFASPWYSRGHSLRCDLRFNPFANTMAISYIRARAKTSA
ncbi:hypothetical protein NL676_020947 [Syzygium grande]|nr:hypothetical protein NL676_020947 [Syzygium grande]